MKQKLNLPNPQPLKSDQALKSGAREAVVITTTMVEVEFLVDVVEVLKDREEISLTTTIATNTNMKATRYQATTMVTTIMEENQPINYQQRGRGYGFQRGRGRGYVECQFCHKPRHVIAECWHKKAEYKKNNAGLIHENREEAILLARYGDDTDEVWYLDSGPRKHMTSNIDLLSNSSMENHGQVKIGDARAYKIEGMCEGLYRAKSGKIERMAYVYYVPGLKSNLQVLAIW